MSILVISCAPTKQYTKLSNASTLNPSKATIIVMRTNYFGYAINTDIYEGETLRGRLGPKSFLSWEVDPGTVFLKCDTGKEGYYTIDAKQGKTYYIQQKFLPHLYLSNTDFEVLDQDLGLAMLNKLKSPQMRYSD